jgi:hypothetical protein
VAEDDHAALAVSEIIFDACSDSCVGFELWQGTRLLWDNRVPPLPPRISLTELTEKMQASVVEREEALLRSNWAVSRSRRLMERLSAVRAMGSSGGSTPNL